MTVPTTLFQYIFSSVPDVLNGGAKLATRLKRIEENSGGMVVLKGQADKSSLRKLPAINRDSTWSLLSTSETEQTSE